LSEELKVHSTPRDYSFTVNLRGAGETLGGVFVREKYKKNMKNHDDVFRKIIPTEDVISAGWENQFE